MKRKFAVLLFVAVAFAAEKPLNELSKMRLLNGYKDAVIAQQSLQAAQAAVQANQAALTKAVADYHALEAAEAKANGLGEGTTFSVDIATGTVTAVKAESKPEPPKEKK
jgi:hypothetical protein